MTKHPPTPPAIPTAAVLERGELHVTTEHTASAYYADVPGARLLAEAQVLTEVVEAIRDRHGPRIADDARRMAHKYVHRPPAWPGDWARVWVTVSVSEYRPPTR